MVLSSKQTRFARQRTIVEFTKVTGMDGRAEWSRHVSCTFLFVGPYESALLMSCSMKVLRAWSCRKPVPNMEISDPPRLEALLGKTDVMLGSST
jgi:hypothetical protein